MCGFVGQWNPNGIRPNQIERAADLLKHRGPDDAGSFHDDFIAFGFRRLSILDLSPAGHQPMTNAEGTLHIMHNGEIYNYIEVRNELSHRGFTFRSTSDTEVILAAYEAWGVQCFEKFNGMWAIALWDSRAKMLLLSRDRFGEKPLYYAPHETGLVFGSELKSILACLPKTPLPNDRIVFDYLAYAFHDHTEETFFSGIKQVLPGTVLIANDRGVSQTRYWTLQPTTTAPRTEAAAAEEFRALLTDSIQIRLRSDVAIGTCLSGGLDSSSIALLAFSELRKTSSHFTQKTFTACSNDPRYDERQYSRLVNAAIGADAHEVVPSPEEFVHAFGTLLDHQEEPFLSLSMFAQWKVMETVKANGVTVLLDGQGGDEILAGYIPFFASFLAHEFRAGHIPTLLKELRGFLRMHRASLADILPTFGLYLLPSSIGKFALALSKNHALNAMQQEFKHDYFQYPTLPRPFKNELKNHMYRLLTSTGVRALLHYEDRNAMAFSVESRVPFLDHRLAELTLGLPDRFLLSNGETKRLLRMALKDILPAEIRQRKDKMGFVVPQAEWLQGRLREQWSALLLDKRQPAIASYVRPEAIRNTAAAFLAGRSSLNGILWRWYNLEFWLQHYYG